MGRWPVRCRGLVTALAFLAATTALAQAPVTLAVLPLEADPDAPYAASYRLRLDTVIRAALAADTRIRLVERPPRPGSRFEPAALILTGTLQGPMNGGRIALTIFDAGTGEPVARTQRRASPSEASPALLDLVGRSLARWRSQRPAPRSQTPPGTAAVLAYARALTHADRRDTAAAVRYLIEALRLAPSFSAACQDLRRLRPATSCP